MLTSEMLMSLVRVGAWALRLLQSFPDIPMCSQGWEHSPQLTVVGQISITVVFCLGVLLNECVFDFLWSHKHLEAWYFQMKC